MTTVKPYEKEKIDMLYEMLVNLTYLRICSSRKEHPRDHKALYEAGYERCSENDRVLCIRESNSQDGCEEGVDSGFHRAEEVEGRL